MLALFMVPWIFNLAQNLPTRHLVHHWDAVWVGFDIMMIAMIAATVYFVIKKRIWVVLSATALATLFIVDAWFDILTSKPGSEQVQAIVLGLIETALAIFTFRLVYLAVLRATPHKNLQFDVMSDKQREWLHDTRNG
jgi:hypothetical protein